MVSITRQSTLLLASAITLVLFVNGGELYHHHHPFTPLRSIGHQQISAT